MDTLVGLAPQNVGYNGNVWFGALKTPGVNFALVLGESIRRIQQATHLVARKAFREKWLLSRSCHRTWICWVGYFFTDSLDSAPFKGEDFWVTFSFCIEQAHPRQMITSCFSWYKLMFGAGATGFNQQLQRRKSVSFRCSYGSLTGDASGVEIGLWPFEKLVGRIPPPLNGGL